MIVSMDLGRFETYCERKTREAREVPLEGFDTVSDAAGLMRLTVLGNPWTHDLFDGPFYASSPAGSRINLVFVQSRDGNTDAANPSDLGGGDTDKHLIYEGLSRIDVDGVLAGATT